MEKTMKPAQKTTEAAKAPVRRKTECPLSRAEFVDAAKPLHAKVGDHNTVVGVKEFSSGSFGFYGNEKVTLMVGDTPMKFQMQISLVAVGSKEAE